MDPSLAQASVMKRKMATVARGKRKPVSDPKRTASALTKMQAKMVAEKMGGISREAIAAKKATAKAKIVGTQMARMPREMGKPVPSKPRKPIVRGAKAVPAKKNLSTMPVKRVKRAK